jgi:hypothetical protein
VTLSGPLATLGGLAKEIVRFLTGPVSPGPLGIYRCLVGCLALVNGLLLAPDLDAFFGADGVLPAAPAGEAFRIDLVSWLGSTPLAVRSVFAASMAAAAFTAVGLGSRLATAVLFVTTVSFHHRNPFLLSSGDTMLRVMAFLLMLSPSGAAFSLDALLRSWRCGGAEAIPRTIPGTAVRVMQLQICIAYLATGIWKACGSSWRDGTAVFLVMQLGQFRGFPLPAWAESAWFSRVATWSTLGLELLAPFLLWSRRTRLPTIAALAALHLALEYAVIIQLFQPIMLAGLVLFLTERPGTERPGAFPPRFAARHPDQHIDRPIQ